MENEWVAVVSVTLVFISMSWLTWFARRVRQKTLESDINKELLKNGIKLIKKKWIKS